MPFLRLVVDRCAALYDLRQTGGIEALARPGGAPQLLGQGESGATVAVGHTHQRGAGIDVERQRLALDRLGAIEQLGDGLGAERREDHHAGPREQGGVQLETRVLGGGADQRDRAVLHDGQEAVLLGAVEAVDLVDEE